MGTFDLPLREITAGVLDQLVEQKTLEGLQLEYKEQLPTQATRDKFLTFVASFANKAGGDLIYGSAMRMGLLQAKQKRFLGFPV